MKDVITEDLQLLFGDCLERMKEIPDGSVDMVLTDPPYNIAKANNIHTMGGVECGKLGANLLSLPVKNFTKYLTQQSDLHPTSRIQHPAYLFIFAN